MKHTKTLIAIVGPTAVGKTDLSIEVAKALDTHIISADSRQCYKELNIGTSKPTEQQLNLINHHFINAISIHDKYSVGDYEKDMVKVLDLVFKSKNQVVVSGGSGLFVKSLLYGIQKMPVIEPEVRKWTLDKLKNEPIESVQKEILKIDPQWAKHGDMKNPRRIQRILEVWKATNKPLSYFQREPLSKRPYAIKVVFVVRERENLYNRIESRVDEMVSAGLFKEVESLLKYQDLLPLKTVGYQELFSFFNGEINKNEAIDLVKKNTRHYAKRQVTWFKKQKYDLLLSLDKLQNPFNLIIKEILR